jgi:hypothetical protein
VAAHLQAGVISSLTEYFLNGRTDRPRLRVGVLLDTDTLVKPLADVLDQVQRSSYADLVLRVYNTAPPSAVTPFPCAPLPVRLWHILRNEAKRKRLFYAMYNRLDAHFASAERRLLANVDVSPLWAGVPRLDVQPIAKGFVHRFPPEDIQKILEYKLDVLLRFGFNIIRGDILKAARYGIWSYHHGDNDFYRGGPAHFWELVERNPLSGVILQVLTEALDDGQVLCKGLAATENTLWVSKNRVRPYLLGTTFAIRKMYELHRGGAAELTAKAVPPAPYEGKQKIYRTPTNAQVARFLLMKGAAKFLKRPFRTDRLEHWRIGFRVGSPLLIEPGRQPEMSGFRWVRSPAGRFYADPFLTQSNGVTYCFFEDYSYASSRGRISCGRVTPEGDLEDVCTVLDTGGHLSYPFVFQHADETYMIPESWDTGTVDLYRSSAMPDRWEKVTTLLNIRAFDTTVIEKDGTWWMFTSVAEPPYSGHQLLLLSAPALDGPYDFHWHTPVSADVRFARCGGRIIQNKTGMYRLAQDGQGTYGASLRIQRITQLDERNYREETIMTLRPEHGWTGLHSYDRLGTFEVIDGKKPEPVVAHR